MVNKTPLLDNTSSVRVRLLSVLLFAVAVTLSCSDKNATQSGPIVTPPSDWKIEGIGSNLNAVWTSSGQGSGLGNSDRRVQRSDLYTVGDDGLILHYDGESFHAMETGTGAELDGIWGLSPSSIYAVGRSGTVIHYNGSAWSQVPWADWRTYYDANGVWGTSDRDIFLLCETGVAHFDGSRVLFMYVPYQYYSGIWGSVGPSSTDRNSKIDNVFVVGLGGAIAHFDGISWSAMTSGTTNWLHAVWGLSSNDVFAVGEDGTVLHYDGTSWSWLQTPFHYALKAISGRSATDFYVSGEGKVFHFDGQQWSAIASESTGELSALATWQQDKYVGVGLNGTILEIAQSSWKPMLTSTPRLYSIWGTSNHDLYGVGDFAGIQHFDGTAWTSVFGSPLPLFRDIWGFSEYDIFEVGFGTIWQSDFMSASPMLTGGSQSLNAVWGTSHTNAYAVGGEGTILHYDGSGWKDESLSSSVDLWDVWGSSDHDVYAVGSAGILVHYDGVAWNVVTEVPFGGTLDGIWGSSSNDIYIAGSYETLHFDGISWDTSQAGFASYCIWGSSSTNVYAAGAGPSIRHFDGHTWTYELVEGINSIGCLWGIPEGDVFALADHGILLHRSR